MDKNSRLIRSLTWTLVLVLTVFNCSKIISHESVSIFGYLSYIFNVLALLAVFIDLVGSKRKSKEAQYK